MITRRNLFLASSLATLLPSVTLAGGLMDGGMAWGSFIARMQELAGASEAKKIRNGDVAEQGLRLLQQLDVRSSEFDEAVNSSFETSNSFWLWQRLVKAGNLNGGILNIGSDYVVPLHDHPGAIGMLRIISGEAEVWQFDAVASNTKSDGSRHARLQRASHRILRSGDTAVLMPDRGNIHALRAMSRECSMLDFFIPPYETSQRHWYEPLEKEWFNREYITCLSIPQHDYAKA